MNTTSLTKLHHKMVAMTEEWDRLEAELAKLREQEPIGEYEYYGSGECRAYVNKTKAQYGCYDLYAAPVAAPAVQLEDGSDDYYEHLGALVEQHPVGVMHHNTDKQVPDEPALSVPDGDDFNGTTPHLIQCMEALVRLDADGVLVPHGIGHSASRLLSAAANRLRKQTAPSVPEEWRTMMQWLIGQRGKAGHCHARPGVWDDDNGYKAGQPCEQCAMYDRARAMLQSADHSGEVKS